MIDFHTHILPGMDDGADSIRMSMQMLHMSFRQGVDTVVATPHYCADEEYPEDFLRRRNASFSALRKAMRSYNAFPRVIPGAEVQYFPGISEAEGLADLAVSGSRLILIEPPMVPWSDSMLEDIACLRQTRDCIPVIAHVERFMEYLNDQTLMDRVIEWDMLVQVNAGYFLRPQTARKAFENLKNRKIHVIGSDCHNLTTRAPNMGALWQASVDRLMFADYNRVDRNVSCLLRGGRSIL